MTDPQWLKAEEVAAALRISTRAVYRLVKTKQLRGVNLGRTVRIPAGVCTQGRPR